MYCMLPRSRLLNSTCTCILHYFRPILGGVNAQNIALVTALEETEGRRFTDRLKDRQTQRLFHCLNLQNSAHFKRDLLSAKNTSWTFRRSSRPAMLMRNVCPWLCPPVFQFWLRYCIFLRSVVMFANVVNRRFFIQPQTSVCHLMLSSMLQWRVRRLVRCNFVRLRVSPATLILSLNMCLRHRSQSTDANLFPSFLNDCDFVFVAKIVRRR